jgi:hypothetical protein
VFQKIHQFQARTFDSSAETPKKFNSRLAAPTVLQIKPFGKNVEGFSHFGNDIYGLARMFNIRGLMAYCSNRLSKTPWQL